MRCAFRIAVCRVGAALSWRPPCLGSEPQAKPGSPPQIRVATRTATATPSAKIKVADATPEDALRTFMLAVMAHDEAALHVVTLPDPDLDWLLKGPAAPPEVIKEACVPNLPNCRSSG